MTGAEDFDVVLAMKVVNALDDVRRRMESECHFVAHGKRHLSAWSGNAHERWSSHWDSCLTDGLETVQLLAASIDRIEHSLHEFRPMTTPIDHLK